jgi:hypothetical protein
MGSAFGIPSLTLPFCIFASVCHLLLSDGAIKGLFGAIIPIGPEMNYVNFMRNARLEEERAARRADKGLKPAEDPHVDENTRVFYGPSAVSLVAKHDLNVLDRATTDVAPASRLDDVLDTLERPRERHSVIPAHQIHTDTEAASGPEPGAEGEATTIEQLNEAADILLQLLPSAEVWKDNHGIFSRRSTMDQPEVDLAQQSGTPRSRVFSHRNSMEQEAEAASRPRRGTEDEENASLPQQAGLDAPQSSPASGPALESMSMDDAVALHLEAAL